MMAGFEQTGLLPHHLITLITSDRHEGPVHMDNQPVAIGDQHALTGAIEYRGGLAQTLTVSMALAQSGTDSQAFEQSGPGNEDQTGAKYHPEVAVDQLPSQ